MTREANQELGLTPKLRFPDFAQLDAWDFKPLKALAERRSVRNNGEKIVRVLTNSAEYGIVDQKEYFDKDIATKGNLETYFVVAEGDYVYNPRVSSLAPVGPIYKNKVGTGVMSPLYTVFRFDNDENDFYEHYFRSDHWHQYLRLVSNTGARHDRMAIANGDFFEMPIPVPGPAERRKISTFLSSIDMLIAAESDKLEALKNHKKGLLHLLFPMEGEATPRLRFPEFQDAGKWKEHTLGSLLQCAPTYGANAPSVPFDPNLPTYLRITDISEEGRFIQEGKTSVDLKATPVNSMLPGDIALARTGASVGKAYLHDDAQGPLVFAGFLIRIRANSSLVLPDIIYQFLQSQRYWSWVAKTSMRSGQPGINSTEYASLVVPLPKSAGRKGLQEQQRISDCLRSLDRLASATSDKIYALKDHKRALVQQLFPSSDEARS